MSTDAMDAAKIVQDALEDKLAEDIRMLDREKCEPSAGNG